MELHLSLLNWIASYLVLRDHYHHQPFQVKVADLQYLHLFFMILMILHRFCSHQTNHFSTTHYQLANCLNHSLSWNQKLFHSDSLNLIKIEMLWYFHMIEHSHHFIDDMARIVVVAVGYYLSQRSLQLSANVHLQAFFWKLVSCLKINFSTYLPYSLNQLVIFPFSRELFIFSLIKSLLLQTLMHIFDLNQTLACHPM